MDLAALIDQLRKGDPSAGPILVSMVAPRLLGYAGQVGPELGEADCEAVVEAAIEKAVAKIDQFDPSRGTFPAWARTFVKNAVKDWRRSREAETDLPLTEAARTLPDPEEQGGDQTEKDQEATRRDTAVTALVLGLPEPAQLLLRLRFAEELEHPEIAQRLGITAPASRKRLQRILTDLQTRTADDPDLKHLGGEQ